MAFTVEYYPTVPIAVDDWNISSSLGERLALHVVERVAGRSYRRRLAIRSGWKKVMAGCEEVVAPPMESVSFAFQLWSWTWNNFLSDRSLKTQHGRHVGLETDKLTLLYRAPLSTTRLPSTREPLHLSTTSAGVSWWRDGTLVTALWAGETTLDVGQRSHERTEHLPLWGRGSMDLPTRKMGICTAKRAHTLGGRGALQPGPGRPACLITARPRQVHHVFCRRLRKSAT
ncbi:hypothetical protein Bbelb_046340 [Branchiostoma belcheri]|nr:hypothetical protein Bbelb_046340 [Branchiostoma belcheri]